MSILGKAGACLGEFLKLREKGQLVVPERPKFCGNCQKFDSYWAHGSYSRKVEEGSEKAEIKVPRWKCCWCGRTRSELPYFVVPRRRYTATVLAAGVQIYAVNSTTYRDEVSKLGESGPSPAQAFRWVELLCQKAKGLLFDVQSLLISAGMEPEELIELEQVSCPNSERAKKEGKREKLNILAKAISFGQALFRDTTVWILESLGRNFPMETSEAWSIFSSQSKRKSTPHGMKPGASVGF